MDKTTVIHVENSDAAKIHKLTANIPVLDASYGLWIISSRKYGTAPKRSDVTPRYFEFYGISHLIKRGGWYWRKGCGRRHVPAGSAIITTPGTIHDYGCDEDDYIEDSLCFTGAVADQLFDAGIISDGIMEIGSARKLLPVIELSASPLQDSQIKANLTLQKLLIDSYLARKYESGSDIYTGITALLEQIQQDPGRWWTTADMAEFSNLSENQFRLVFKRKTGMSPKLYVDEAKMKIASDKLCNSSMTIEKIAALLGYRDPYHFSRRFKQLTGVSPDQYRKAYRIY